MTQSSRDELDLVIRTMARTIVDNADHFAQLDAVAGDGDFGYSLRNGWEVVVADYDSWDLPTTGAVLKKIGATLAAKVGGVSGPMWGTAFLRAGGAAAGADGIGADEAVAMLRAGIDGVKQRGGSDVGDKTLIDALVPAADALEERLRAGDDGAAALAAAAEAAREAAEATRPMLAKRGRAAYTGERSIGTLDAGAVGVAVMFERLAEAWPTR